jgi:chromate transporter
MSSAASPSDAPPVAPLGELFWVFLRLGVLSFGGPAAHLALMEDELVKRRRWLSAEQFADLVGAANLLPGPTSTEVALFIGRLRRGWLGLLIAGACFILPAALLVGVLAWAYVSFHALPRAEGLLRGLKPAVVVIIVQALTRLAPAALKTRGLVVLAVLAAGLAALNVNPLLVLLAAGLLPAALRRRPDPPPSALLLAAAPAAPAAAAGAMPLGTLFLLFLKIGAVLYGGGYVLLAFLEADLVEGDAPWLTRAQLLDAVAAGQVTPGPVFTTATFLGYLLAGPAGAAIATVAIFLPAFVYVAAAGPLLPRLRRSARAAAFLDGVAAGALALTAVVACRLAVEAVRPAPGAAFALTLGAVGIDLAMLTLGVVGAAALFRYRFNSFYLLLAGGCVGLLLA